MSNDRPSSLVKFTDASQGIGLLQLKILITLGDQTLSLLDSHERLLERFSVSTAKRGAGNLINSQCTPLGLHQVRAKIGEGLPSQSVFVGRRPTGEIYTPELAWQYPGRDWILSRILWLSGLEPGKNRLGDCDTMRRFIYIHGTPDSEPMGIPASHGCIRMRNADVITVFERVSVNTPVMIEL